MFPPKSAFFGEKEREGEWDTIGRPRKKKMPAEVVELLSLPISLLLLLLITFFLSSAFFSVHSWIVLSEKKKVWGVSECEAHSKRRWKVEEFQRFSLSLTPSFAYSCCWSGLTSKFQCFSAPREIDHKKKSPCELRLSISRNSFLAFDESTHFGSL